MSSKGGGHDLPSINSPGHHRPGDDKNKKAPSRETPGRGHLPQRVNSTSQMPTARRNLRHGQPSQQSSLGESGSELHHAAHGRTGRLSSVGGEDADWSRNWNSEGGRPKRERTFSDRSDTRRLLHRSAINSTGQLIPFQRAPRDGSYESHLPLGKKPLPPKLTRQGGDKEVLSPEQRRAARSVRESPESNDGQNDNLMPETLEKVPGSSGEGQKRQTKAKDTSANNDGRKEGPKVTRKRSTQEGGTSFRRGPADVRPRAPAQRNMMSQGVTSSQGDEQERVTDNQAVTETAMAGIEKTSETSNHAAANTLTSLEDNGQALHSQHMSGGSNTHSVHSSRRPPSEHLGIGDYDEDEPTFNQAVRLASPSAEFKAAAHQQGSASDTGSSTSITATISASSTSQQTPINESSHSATGSSSSNQPEVHVRTNELGNVSQPNSVVRRRVSSSGTIDTSQIQSSQVPGPSRISASITQSSRWDRNLPRTRESSGDPSTQASTATGNEPSSQSGSASQQQSSQSNDAIGVSNRLNTAHPPLSGSTNSAESAGSNGTSQQTRFNRFGRRIRIPSSDSAVVEESEHSQQEPNPPLQPDSEERFEGTNRQRYRFFSLSRSRSETNNEIPTPSLYTPNRDLLYGSSSPPLLRRHQRTHFGTSASTPGNSVAEPHASASTRSSLSSSSEDADLNLGRDSFRTAAGGTAVFSPILQSGPTLDSSSSSVPHHRRRFHESAPRTSVATDTSFSSSNSSSPREVHRWNSSPQSQHVRGVADVDRSSDYDVENLTFSVEDGRLGRDARRRYQSDRNDAIPRLLPQRSRQPSRDLPRGTETTEDVFRSPRDHTHLSRSPDQSPLQGTAIALEAPLLTSPLFASLGINPGMLLSLLIRTRREFGQEFMELLLENMMLNILAHHLFEAEGDGNNGGINGAPPPATQDIIDNLKETPALETHIAKEMKCAICHSEYELYEMLAELPCNHFFHPTCVAMWLKKSGTCPVCRFQLTSATR